VTFDSEQFVMRRLSHLELCGRVGKPNDWWRWFD
jgi:hypothetical protein